MIFSDPNKKAYRYSSCCKGFVVGALLASVALAALLTLRFTPASTMATELSTIIVTTATAAAAAAAAAATTTTIHQSCKSYATFRYITAKLKIFCSRFKSTMESDW